ncbi:glycosyltransferase family 2 protein [Flavobacteriaceae bacterium]|nr:glycosyltransferase family 2 protein [Flavobacteriaceae bacterium]
MKKLSIIIPVYNEERTILQVLNKLVTIKLIQSVERELVIVNDNSTDESEKIILNFKKDNPKTEIQYFKHEKNKGKGAALNTAFSKVTGDIIIIQDADLEYDPEEFNRLLKPILDGFADVVYGSRFKGSNPHRALFFWHTVGNNFLTFLSNMFSNLNLTDMETCYKMIKKEIIQSIEINENRFGIEPEITAKISKIKGVRIYEVGISYYGRTYEEGKKIGWKDGFRAIYCIVKYNLFK